MRGNTLRSMFIIVLISLLLAGCLFGPDPSTSEIDPPPDTTAVDSDAAEDEGEATEADVDMTNEEEEAANSETALVELYFRSADGFVVPYTAEIPKTEGIAKEALTYMVKDGAMSELDGLPEGFSSLLPEGTKIIGLDIKENGVANLDLSEEFLNYEPEDEEDLLGAITWALTAWDSIDKVNLWINGEPLAYMPKGNTPAVNMTRDNTAINIEMAEGVQISNSMPVTLYFLGQTGESIYFVPVTRMVSRDHDVAKVTIEQLVAGPLASSSLNTEITNNLEVHDIAVEDDVVLADLGEQLLEYGQENKASEHAIQSIVLSLTENTGASQVKISIDGKSNVASENISLAEPVTRPAKINPFPL